jgi:SHS2 domain-containing protein
VGAVVYRWEDHTGEIALILESADEQGIFADALTALGDLLHTEEPSGPVARRELDLVARDDAALLVEWLGELAFLAETQGLVPERATDLDLDGTHLHATIEGRIGEPRHLVKAVTYHGLRLEREAGLWRASVVLDV